MPLMAAAPVGGISTGDAQVIGTLFAVLLAFVILAAFQTYNSAKTGSAADANAVLDMARTAALFRPLSVTSCGRISSATGAQSSTKSGPP